MLRNHHAPCILRKLKPFPLRVYDYVAVLYFLKYNISAWWSNNYARFRYFVIVPWRKDVLKAAIRFEREMRGSEVMDLLCLSEELSDNCRGLFTPLSSTLFFFFSPPSSFRETSATNAAPAPGNPQKSAMQSTTNSFPSVHSSLYEYTRRRTWRFHDRLISPQSLVFDDFSVYKS